MRRDLVRGRANVTRLTLSYRLVARRKRLGLVSQKALLLCNGGENVWSGAHERSYSHIHGKTSLPSRKFPNGWRGTYFAESHAAAVKHNVITIEKAMGRIKRYLQLTTVMAAKQRANAHAVPRMSPKVAAGRPPSCHANIAANR